MTKIVSFLAGHLLLSLFFLFKLIFIMPWKIPAALGRLWAMRTCLKDVIYCPNGHPNKTYGMWECSCSAKYNGWIFGRCPVCKQTCGFFPCSVCGISIKNPMI